MVWMEPCFLNFRLFNSRPGTYLNFVKGPAKALKMTIIEIYRKSVSVIEFSTSI